MIRYSRIRWTVLFLVLFNGLVLGSVVAQTNGSLRFYGNGTGDIDRVKISVDNPPTAVDVGGDFTIEFFMQAIGGENNSGTCTTGEAGWTNGNIIIDRDIFGSGDNGDFGVSVFGGGGVIAFGVSVGVTGSTICGATNVIDGNWHHIAGTRNLTTGLLTLYVDGNVDGSTGGPVGDVSYRDGRATSWPNDPFLVIGAEKHDFSPAFPSYSGWIDEVRISNNIRYATAFTVPTAPFTTDAATVGLYHFDEGSGNQINDSSGTGSNGVRQSGGTPAGPVWSTKTPFLVAGGPSYASTPLTGSVIDLGSTSVGVQITDNDALVIGNNGSSSLTAIFSLSGGDLTNFTINTGPGSIASGNSLDVSISCNPNVPGLRETTLQVSHNAPGSPAQYTLRCRGTAPNYTSIPSPSGSINVGTANVGSTVTNSATFSISNSGTEALNVGFATSGTNAADFTIVTLDQSIAIGGTLPVSISCTPSAPGIRVATLSVNHNDLTITNPATYALNCTGTAPIYTSTPNSGETITLGPSQIGSPVINAAALLINNTGTSNLNVDFSIAGGNLGDFAINTTPTTQTIAGSSNLSVSLTCTPSAIGTRTTTLTVTHNAAGSPATYNVECEGLAVGTPIYSSTPGAGTPINFGNVTIITSSTNATALVINNTGTAPLTVAFDITGGDAADFSPTPADTTVAQGIPLNVSLTCTPSAIGARTTTLTVNHNGVGSPAIYTLNCTGTPVAVPIYDSTPLSGQSIDLGSSPVGVGITNAAALVIRNTGTAALNIAFSKSGADQADFTINTANQSIAAAGTLNVSITCTPGAAVARSATLTVTHDAAGTPATHPLTCTGTPAGAPGYGSNPGVAGTLSISTPPSVSGSATLTISETGGSALTISSYSISGSIGTLSVSGPAAPFTINNGGASQALTIRCLNATPGIYSGTLTVNHNATGNPATYTVNCTVTTPGNPGFSSVPAAGSTINVGTVQIGTAISTNLLISNPGTATLLVTLPAGNILITGPNAADFAVITNSPPFSVQPNNAQTIAVTIRCIPTIAGLEVATLTLQTNAPGQTTVSYALNCIGSGTPVLTATPVGFVATASPFVPTPTPVLPATGTVSTEVKGLAMRTGPYLGATLIGAIRPGTAYNILAQSNDESPQFIWYLVIDANNVTGWVSGRFLEISGNLPVVPFQGSIFDTLDNVPDTGVTARAMSIIDIRRRPSGRAAILGQISQHASISLLGRTRQNGGDFWIQVRYNGIIGWIPAAPIEVNGTTQNVPIR